MESAMAAAPESPAQTGSGVAARPSGRSYEKADHTPATSPVERREMRIHGSGSITIWVDADGDQVWRRG
jgi:hypothetical protein